MTSKASFITDARFGLRGCIATTHFYASALINEGVDAAAVSGALGHSVIGTTLGIYTHEFQEAQARTSDIIAAALNFGKTKEPTAT